MTRPRSTLIPLEATPYYHCIARCDLRAFPCGRDKQTGRNFYHRKAWLEQRFKLQAEVFAMQIPAYAVMSNNESSLIDPSGTCLDRRQNLARL